MNVDVQTSLAGYIQQTTEKPDNVVAFQDLAECTTE